MISSNFIFNFTNFCVILRVFFTKLLTLAILFLTAVRVVAVAKSVILSILLLTSFILALIVVVATLVILVISCLTSFILVFRVVLLAKLVISGILSLIFMILALYTSSLTT